MTTATVFVPRAVAAPRGAALVGLIHNYFSRLLARHTEARAEASRELEAEYVRRYARELQATDPGFANDLFAAADRHERQE